MNEVCCLIHIEFRPTKRDNGFVIQYNMEYSDYQIPDILSGIGGILSTANGIVAVIMSGLLCGVTFLCINWNGLAPYPSFDDNFKQRLQRLLE